MLPEERDPGYLWNARRAGRSLQEFVSGKTFEEYLEDRVLPSAVERQFEVLGEACRKVSESFRDAHPEIPWKRIIGVRNIIAHRYYAVDHALLWEIIHGELVRLLQEIERLLPTPPPISE